MYRTWIVQVRPFKYCEHTSSFEFYVSKTARPKVLPARLSGELNNEINDGLNNGLSNRSPYGLSNRLSHGLSYVYKDRQTVMPLFSYLYMYFTCTDEVVTNYFWGAGLQHSYCELCLRIRTTRSRLSTSQLPIITPNHSSLN